jgi:fumarate reductase flavoprotein subunit
MNPVKSFCPEHLETEIVIVGGGGAGLAAAVAAGERGAKVILLEKRTAWGGNSALAGGIFAAESPVQKRMMIDARRDELFKRAMDYSHWKADPEIVRAFVYKSGDSVRWLEEKGLKFGWIPPLYPNQVPRVLHWPEGGGAALVKLLAEQCKGLGISQMDQTAAKRILTEGRGRVAGVLAARDEREITIHARAVIIATGGYGGNKALLMKYDRSYSENRLLTAIPHTGDGLIMCIEAGSATEGLGLLLLSGPRVPGSFLLSAIAAEPSPMMVNRLGKRFSDENIPCHFERGNTVDRQPDKICFALFDAGIKRFILGEGLKRPGWGLDREVLHLQPRIDPDKLEQDLQAQVEKGIAKISPSWDEIAQWMGAPPQDLQATVNQYNHLCDHRRDDLFAKDPAYLLPLRSPPYYAVRCHSGFLGTIGGIKINHRMEVLNTQDQAISGLYAAGVDAGGWQGDTYSGRDLAGSAFGFAINSGRIAGENAAAHVSSRGTA